MDYLLIIIWFLFLIKWADFLVDWASSVAKKYGISNLVIGLTIVAFWTSAPELVVNLISWVTWNTDLAISNVLWSNISNILLILWVTSLFYPIAFPHKLVKWEIPFYLWIAVLLAVLVLDKTLGYWEENILSMLDAVIFAVIFAGFVAYTFKQAKSPEEDQDEGDVKEMTTGKASLLIVLGLAGLVGWGKLIVDSAVSIAEGFGLSQALIWVTIVAIWTSLPELAASVVAALKKNTDLAIWGVVGSNIFNTLWILWATGLITDLPGYVWIERDMIVNILASALLLIFALVHSKMMITRVKGVGLVFCYFAYIWYLIYTI